MEFVSRSKCVIGENEYVFTSSRVNSKGQCTEYFRCNIKKCRATLHVRPLVKKWRLSVEHTLPECSKDHQNIMEEYIRRGLIEEWNSFALSSLTLSTIPEETDWTTSGGNDEDSSNDASGEYNNTVVETSEMDPPLVNCTGELDESTLSSGSQTESNSSIHDDSSTIIGLHTGIPNDSEHERLDESSIVTELHAGIPYSGEYGLLDESSIQGGYLDERENVSISLDSLLLNSNQEDFEPARKSSLKQNRESRRAEIAVSPIGPPLFRREILTPAPIYSSTPNQSRVKHSKYPVSSARDSSTKHRSRAQSSAPEASSSSKSSSERRREENSRAGFGPTYSISARSGSPGSRSREQSSHRRSDSSSSNWTTASESDNGRVMEVVRDGKRKHVSESSRSNYQLLRGSTASGGRNWTFGPGSDNRGVMELHFDGKRKHVSEPSRSNNDQLVRGPGSSGSRYNITKTGLENQGITKEPTGERRNRGSGSSSKDSNNNEARLTVLHGNTRRNKYFSGSCSSEKLASQRTVPKNYFD